MIESLQNTKVKNWIKLKRKKDRIKSQSFLIEGEHLIEEAIHSDWIIKEIIVDESYESELLHPIKEPITKVASKVFSAISNTESPQGIMAEMQMKQFTYPSNMKRILILDAIQDPGNVGTMIRTADAFSFDAIIIGTGTVDVYNEKVCRASQGSLFHLPILSGELAEWIPRLKQDNFSIWATALKDATSLPELSPPEKVAVIFGNEGSGVDKELLALSDERVFIPITGKAESLNVSIASSIVMYNLRQ